MIHLYCGDGKGKTTASVGLAVRACGSGKRVMFTQFLKGQETGELSCLRLLPEITVLRGNLSKKFTFQMTAEERKAEAAENERLLEEAFHQARENGVQLLILDESVTAAQRDMISGERLKELVESHRENFEIVMTGAVPDGWMVELADYVTDMEKIKHPFDKGVMARAGIEY